MGTDDLLTKMKELDTESLLHELRESRRRAIDFMDAQQSILIELKSRPPEVVENTVEQEVVENTVEQEVVENTVEQEVVEGAAVPEESQSEEKSEAPLEEEAFDNSEFFISQDELSSIIDESKKTEPETEKKVNAKAEFEKDLEFSDELSVSPEDAQELLVQSQIGKVRDKVNSSKSESGAIDQSEIDALLETAEDSSKSESGALDQSEIDALLETAEDSSKSESGAIDQSEIDVLLETAEDSSKSESGAIDQSEIDALLNGEDEAEDLEEGAFDMLDQSAIDDLLEGIEPEPGVGEIDLEDLAAVTNQQESLSSEDVTALLENAEDVEEDVKQFKYERVEESEVLELEAELNEARALKKIADQQEVERLKLQGRAGNNENKKKPTAEEIAEGLIDSEEAKELDEQLRNLKEQGA